MAKSGMKRGRPKRLDFVQRYSVALAITKQAKLDSVAKIFGISIGTVHKIKREFLLEILVWRPGVIRKLSERDLFGVVPKYPDED